MSPMSIDLSNDSLEFSQRNLVSNIMLALTKSSFRVIFSDHLVRYEKVYPVLCLTAFHVWVTTSFKATFQIIMTHIWSIQYKYSLLMLSMTTCSPVTCWWNSYEFAWMDGFWLLLTSSLTSTVTFVGCVLVYAHVLDESMDTRIILTPFLQN